LVYAEIDHESFQIHPILEWILHFRGEISVIVMSAIRTCLLLGLIFSHDDSERGNIVDLPLMNFGGFDILS